VTRYLTLAEYFWLAEQLTGVDADISRRQRVRVSPTRRCIPLRPGFGDVEFYSEIYDKAAVLVCQLAPLPDGNKRAAWADLVPARGTPIHRTLTRPRKPCSRSPGGDMDEAWTAAWLRERVRFVDSG